jgi:hypothetical protein
VTLYATAEAERFPKLVGGIGALGVAILAVALGGRWASLVPLGITGVGAAYAVFLSLRPETVDPYATAVAAGMFLGAELAFWSLEPSVARADRRVALRRIAWLALAVVAVGLLAGSLLLVAGGTSGGVALEAAGVAAAVALLAVLAVLAGRRFQAG